MVCALQPTTRIMIIYGFKETYTCDLTVLSTVLIIILEIVKSLMILIVGFEHN